MSKLTLENISYVYGEGTPFETHALCDVSFGVRENSVTGLIGHTGSGKSTLVQLFNGLAKPTAGRILLDGTDIWEKPKEIKKIRFRVGLVMQYPEYQLFEETVRADIAFGPKNMGLSEAEVAERVHEAAELVGLDGALLDHSPFELSGGEKRRVAIAGVIAMRPEVLVLDEPAAGLDPRGRDNVLRQVCEYRKKSGATVVIVSHSMEDMARYCDRLVVMNDAEILLDGTQSDVFGNAEALQRIGLGVPDITEICAALRAGGMPLPEDIYTVEAATAALLPLLGGDADAE